jgi:hypothetical protein
VNSSISGSSVFCFDVDFAGLEDNLFFTTGNPTTDSLLEQSKLERIPIKRPDNQDSFSRVQAKNVTAPFKPLGRPLIMP